MELTPLRKCFRQLAMAGISVANIARLMHVSRMTLWKWRQGKTKPREQLHRVLAKLASNATYLTEAGTLPVTYRVTADELRAMLSSVPAEETMTTEE